MARRLCKAHGARDTRTVHKVAEVALHLADHIRAEFRAWIEHGKEEAVHLKGGIQPFAYEANRCHELRESLKGIVLTLHGDEDCIGNCKGAHRHEAKGGWGVHQHDLGVPCRTQPNRELALAACIVASELQIDTGKIGRSRHKEEVRHGGGLGKLPGALTVHEQVIGGRSARGGREAEAAGQVPLRVKVYKEHTPP